MSLCMGHPGDSDPSDELPDEPSLSEKLDGEPSEPDWDLFEANV